jgi:hypothetical protein
LAGVVVAIVRIVAISVIDSDPATKPPEVISVAKAPEVISVAKAMEAPTEAVAAVESGSPAKTAAMKAATAVEASATAVETPATAVETPATAVETPATAMEPTAATAAAPAMSVGGIWLAERGNAQQSNRDASQSLSCTVASSLFA